MKFCLSPNQTPDSKGKLKVIQQNGKSVKRETEEDGEEESNEVDENEEEIDTKFSLNNIKYEDPGVGFSDEQTDDDINTERKQIHGLACALLQISQSIDVKYLKPPFGNLKSGGKNKSKEENVHKAKQNLEMWQVSLMNCRTSSQLFLHYNVLYDAIKWTRSAQNAKCVCRSSKDPDKLLLCDGCNIGRHIYCLKPKLTVSSVNRLQYALFSNLVSWLIYIYPT